MSGKVSFFLAMLSSFRSWSHAVRESRNGAKRPYASTQLFFPSYPDISVKKPLVHVSRSWTMDLVYIGDMEPADELKMRGYWDIRVVQNFVIEKGR